MKKLFTSFAVTLLLLTAFVQVNAQGYYYLEATGYAWNLYGAAYNNLVNSQNILMIEDQNQNPLPDKFSPWQSIPFTWTFFGQPVTGYYASNNGYMTFDQNAPYSDPVNTALPSSTDPNNAIYAMWREFDLYYTGSGTDAITNFTWTDGDGNQHHAIYWWSVTVPNNPTSFVYYSIVLHETGGFDIVHHGGANYTTLQGTVGAENASGSQFVSIGSGVDFPASGTDHTNPGTDHVWEFFPGTNQPKYDLRMMGVNGLIRWGSAKADKGPFTVSGVLRNMGSETITSFDLNYTANGGSVVTSNVSATVAPGAYVAYTHPTTWQPAVSGDYEVCVWGSNLNGGNADLNTLNDKGCVDMSVAHKGVDRLPLFEEFTSSTCPPCKPASEALYALTGPDYDGAPNADKWSLIKYQMSWPGSGDPYYTAEANERRNFYGVTGIPRLEIDGGLTFEANGNNVTQTDFDEGIKINSEIEINAFYMVDTSGHNVIVNASVNPLVDINSSNLKLHMAVVEKHTDNNVKSNGETEFWYVMKKMLPDHNGTATGALQAGVVKGYSQAHTFQGSYRLSNNAGDPINHNTEHSIEEFDDLEVVIWVQDASTKEVYNSTWAVPMTSVPSFDLAAAGISIDEVYAISDAPITISGVVQNLGLSPVDSFNVHYSIDGGTEETFMVSGAALNTHASYAFTHTTTWTPPAEGTYEVTVRVSDPDGQVDGNLMNDEFDQSVLIVGGRYDLAAASISINETVELTNAPFNLSAGIQNFGIEEATSFDIHYSIDNGTAVDQAISQTLGTQQTNSFDFDTPWEPTATGVYEIKVWVDNINSGQTDEDNTNDEITMQVTVNHSTVAVEEAPAATNNSLSIYPTPATDFAVASYELASASDVEVIIYDVQGKIISASNLGTQAAGAYNHQIDVEGLAIGVYVVDLRINNTSNAQKLVVSK